MKKPLFLSMTTIFVMFLTANLNAQPPSPEEMAKQETEAMKAGLNLTADQLSKVEVINLKYAQKIGEMFSQGPVGDFSEMEKKMTEMEKQKRVEFEKVLIADQLKKYDAMIIEQRKNRPGPPM